jgi:hypothetical protein
MSSNLYNRFAAFKALHGQRLGKDILGVICQKVELKPVDFIDKIDDMREEMFVYTRTADEHVGRLYATYDDERFEYGAVTVFEDQGWGPAARVNQEDILSRKRAKIRAACNEYHRVYDDCCANIKRMKTEIVAVRAEFHEFVIKSVQ